MTRFSWWSKEWKYDEPLPNVRRFSTCVRLNREISIFLRHFQIPNKLVGLIQMAMEDTISCVDTQGKRRDYLKLRQGLK